VLPNELRDFSALGVLAFRGGARILGFSRLRLNGTHQLLVYADDVYVWGRSMHTIKQNRSLVVSGK
jgi:hypothetical protein